MCLGRQLQRRHSFTLSCFKKAVCARFGRFVQRQLICVIEDPEVVNLLMLYTYCVFDISFPKLLDKSLSFLSYLIGISCSSTSKIQNLINLL